MAHPVGGGYGYTLMHAAQCWRTEATAALEPYDLTVPQFLVMMALYRQYRQYRHDWPPLTQAEVSTRLGMDANTTSQVARALERRGLLARSPHAHDARARALALTDLGIVRSRDASAAARAHNDRFFSAIDPAQLDTLATLLETLSTASEHRS